MTIWEVSEPPKGFGGHEFVYVKVNDLFRCENCDQYEISVRDSQSGEITPCPNQPGHDAEHASGGEPGKPANS